VTSASSVPASSVGVLDSPLTVEEDLPSPSRDGSSADALPPTMSSTFGSSSPHSSEAGATSKPSVGVSNPLGGAYWAKSREALMTRVSSNKLTNTLGAFRFSSMYLATYPNILLISSHVWRPQNGALLFKWLLINSTLSASLLTYLPKYLSIFK
jgi:hypothetical protein